MRAAARTLLALMLVACAGLTLVWHLALREPARPDAVALNDAIHVVEQTWPATSATDLEAVGAPVVLVGPDGTALTSSGASDPAPTTAVEAARHGWLSAPVVVEGSLVATLYLHDDAADRQADAARRLARWATVVVIALVAGAAVLVTRTHRRIVEPFERLRSFATRVADGDLDAPLSMDRGNVFGAWTESFDLMRTELARARSRQEAAERSKRELVAQIGHDIRTPVASICATAEVLRTMPHPPQVDARLHVIEAKAHQLQALVADLFEANEDQMDALEVSSTEMSSTELVALVRDADYEQRAQIGTVPECLVSADSHRLAQVLDNVLVNSYKYARTPVEVSGSIDGDLLLLEVCDSGPGVGPHELGPIFTRGFRGAGAGQAPGQGIGLFTCAWLMERMGGTISAANVEQPGSGLRVTIAIPLAGR